MSQEYETVRCRFCDGSGSHYITRTKNNPDTGMIDWYQEQTRCPKNCIKGIITCLKPDVITPDSNDTKKCTII